MASKALVAAVCLGMAPWAQSQVTVDQPIPQKVTIDVDARKALGGPIPRTIFGTFLEPIGNSTYNGLWAELLENPSLEAGLWSSEKVADMLRDRPELREAGNLSLPLPWEPLNRTQGNRYELHAGDAANTWQSLRVFGVPGEPTGIKQKIYLPIHRTQDYGGSFYARHLGGADQVTVSLRVRDSSDVLAQQQLQVDAPEWKKYTFRLSVQEGKLHRLDPADFVVQLAGDERIELDEFSLMPADALEGMDPDAVAMARDMHTPLVRFGGNFTSSYHWQDGVGPRDKRVSVMNNAWGIPETNFFGTDEFLAFCKLIGAQPQVALNLGSGTPAEAAGWVRYVNDHWSTHSGLLWELGNELWGNWNLGYPTREQLAARTLDFSKAIKQVDPAARLIATGADPDVFTSWNALQLTNPPGTYDFLSTHFVVTTSRVKMAHAEPAFLAAASFALPIELERKLQAQQQQIDGTPGYRGKAHIAFTEWLFLADQYSAPTYNNMGGAVVAGGLLNMLVRNAQIVPVSDMTGIMEFAGIWKKRSQVYATPTYYVFQMYAGADMEHRVAATADSGAYSVKEGVGRLPQIASVPYLDVVAGTDASGKKLTLFCVNRSVDTDIPATVRLENFAAAGRAKVRVVAANALSAANDEMNPTAVVSVESTEPIKGGSLAHVFPQASVTMILVDRE